MKKSSLALLSLLGLFQLLATQGAPAQTPAEDIEIQVSPHTILLSWKARGDVRVTVHAEINYSTVATLTVELGGYPAITTYSDARGDLVAKFNYEDVALLVREGTAVLVLTGETKDGESFRGEDMVRVVS
jgi:hypothetical protein